MFRYTLSLFLVLLATATLLAQSDLNALDDYFAKARQDWEVPGMAVAIVKDGEIVLSKGYGTLGVGNNAPVDGNTVFAIASNTKAFISAAIGMLVEEGKLNWDDPVQKHLPYFELYAPYVTAHTTVRDLLCHRVGLGTFSGDVIWYKNEQSAEEVIRRTRHVPQAYEYRAGYGYSNLMFITAGEVIRAASGQPWNVFVQERILQPLGMARTLTTVTGLEGLRNVATPHKPVDGQERPIPYVNWDNMGAAGGILSSVNDMARWLQLQLDGGEFADQQLFKAETQEEWWHPHNNNRVSASARERFPARHFSAYGLGWGLFDWGGRFVAGHSGGYDGMYSHVALAPEEDLGIVVLTNSMTGIGTYLMYSVLDAYLGLPTRDWSRIGLESHRRFQDYKASRIQERLDNRQTGTQPSLRLPDYAGTYHDPMYGDIVVKVEDSRLRLTFPEAPALNATLTHWHHDTFEINWDEVHAWFDFGTVNFNLDHSGTPVELRFDVPNDDIFFHEIQAIRTAD